MAEHDLTNNIKRMCLGLELRERHREGRICYWFKKTTIKVVKPLLSLLTLILFYGRL